MFDGCSKLRAFNLSHFKIDESKGLVIESMFKACDSLTNVDISNLKSNSDVFAYGAFQNCYNLITIYCNGFKSYRSDTFMLDNCSPKGNIDKFGNPSQNGVFTTK